MIGSRGQPIPGESRVQKILIGITVPSILAFFFVLGRAISRVKIVQKWSADDTLIVIAWLSSLTLPIMFGIATQYGQGHHIEDVPLELLQTSFLITYTSLMTYQLTLCLTKISILVLYLRVFPGRRERWLSWITIGFVVSYCTPFIILDALECNPITDASFFGANIVCVRPRGIMTASAILHTLTDIWMVVMIIPVIWSLQIPPRQKYTLVAIMSLGLFVAVASIARIVSILKADDNDPDVTWIIADFDIWTVVECSTGLTCACAPTIRPLLFKKFPKLLASRQDTMTMKNPYGRRSVPARRMSGAIELASTEALAVDTKSPGSPNGHWRESEKPEDTNIKSSSPGKGSGVIVHTVTRLDDWSANLPCWREGNH